MGLLSVIPLPYRILAMALAAAALYGLGWFRGNEHGTAKLTEYIGEQAREAVRIVTRRGEVTQKVVREYVKIAGKTEFIVQEITKEGIKYADVNPGFCLDARWRLLHDGAAANAVPDPAAGADGAGGAPLAAEALGTVTANYAACHRTADRLTALQAWAREQAAVR